MHDRIKVNNRTGNIADVVTIARAGTGAITLTIAPGTPFSKRYLKYLTKKFLKKEQLREYVRVVSTKKDAYILKYFNIEEDGADDDEE